MTSIVLSSQSGGNLGTFPPTPESLRAAHDAFVQTAVLQNALGGLPTVQMLLVLTGLAAWFLQRQSPTGSRQILPFTAIAIIALPLGMLILPPVAPGNVWGAGALLAAFTLLLAGLALRRGTALPLLSILSGTLLGVTLVDLLAGSHLLQQAWMSYSVMEGARFYGLGNEYMGAVIGAGCVLLGARENPTPNTQRPTPNTLHPTPYTLHPTPYSLLPVLLLVLGWSRFGAKVGAIPSAGAAFGVVCLVQWRGRLRARDVVMLIVAAGLLLGALALLDLRHAAGEQSHLARAISGAGGGNLFEIARRKLLLEGYLLLHSPWSATLAVSAFGMFWLRRSCAETFASRADKAVFAGLLAGALASLLCNDAGLLAAALILLYGWAWAAIRVSAGNISDEVTSNQSG